MPNLEGLQIQTDCDSTPDFHCVATISLEHPLPGGEVRKEKKKKKSVQWKEGLVF